MSQEEIKPCVICHDECEQMLMLSCVHDPCINCAATHFCQKEAPTSKYYKCPKCYVKTELDASSIQQLSNIYNRLNSKKRYQYKHSYSKPILKEHSQNPRRNYKAEEVSYKAEQVAYKHPYKEQQKAKRLQQREGNSYKSSQLDKRAKIISCPDHPEDELSYYCFTCTKMICPECAIHGEHQQHEVQSSKRAVREIKQNLTELRDQVTSSSNLTSKERDENKELLKEEMQRNKYYHSEIKNKLTVLRNHLLEKEKHLVRKVDTNHQQNCTFIRQRSGEVDSLFEDCHHTKQKIDNLLKSEDMLVMQHYAQTQEEIRALIEQKGNDEKSNRVSGCSFSDMNQKLVQIQHLLEGLDIEIVELSE